MSLVNGPPPRRPDLLREASREGISKMWMGGVALLLTLVITVVSLVGMLVGIVWPFAICFVLFFGFAALILLPFGLFAYIVPTSHVSLRPLGENADERRRAADQIAETFAGPDGQHQGFTKRRMFCLSPEWAAVVGRELVLFRRADLLHVWVKTTVQRSFVVFTSRTYELNIRTMGAKYSFELPERDLEGLVQCLQIAHPPALFGYDQRLEGLEDAQLREIVDARAAG